MTKFATAVALLILLFSASDSFAAADLRITAEELNSFLFGFHVENLGPDVAHDVVLHVEAPAGVRIIHYGEQANCPEGTPVRCSVSMLAKGATLDFVFEAGPPYPVVDATYTITGRAESATADPDLSNNTTSVQFVTHEAAALSEQVEPGVARVDPGATQVFVTELDNHSGSIPRDVHIRYTVTNAVIESIQPQDSRWTCTVSGAEGECVAASLDQDCLCSRQILVTVRASSDRAGGEAKLLMQASSNLPNEYEVLDGEATLQTYRVFAVTSTADAGPGSLRDAIVQANAGCTPGPCKILFELPPPVPADGWFTLVPASRLPPMIGERIALDGTSQTRFTGDTNPRGPEIFIDGHLAWRGLELRAGCEAIVQGLALGHFGGGDALFVGPHDVECAYDQPDLRLITGNYIGVDPTGTRAYPNQRGLNVEGFAFVRENVISRNKWSGIWVWTGTGEITKNLIEDNGKSGIVLGPGTEHVRILENTINRQAEMGVAVAPGAKLYEIRVNSMRDNGGLGIDIDIDGVSSAVDDDKYPEESNAPVLLSAVYDASRDRTVVKLVLHSSPLGPYGNSVILDVYANRGPDGDGEQRVYSSQGGPIETIEIHGNYTGQWLNATSTRSHSSWAKPPDDKGSNAVRSQSYPGEGRSTSELSNAILVTAQ
ncbi:MAG TPA: right-handed parallel beta-helix repeat-containing protein [Thermoanaerobaculia bacterium]|jgi:hypothetical protein